MASLKSSLTVYLSEIDALFVFLEKVFICFRQIMSCIKNLPKLVCSSLTRLIQNAWVYMSSIF